MAQTAVAAQSPGAETWGRDRAPRAAPVCSWAAPEPQSAPRWAQQRFQLQTCWRQSAPCLPQLWVSTGRREQVTDSASQREGCCEESGCWRRAKETGAVIYKKHPSSSATNKCFTQRWSFRNSQESVLRSGHNDNKSVRSVPTSFLSRATYRGLTLASSPSLLLPANPFVITPNPGRQHQEQPG